MDQLTAQQIFEDIELHLSEIEVLEQETNNFQAKINALKIQVAQIEAIILAREARLYAAAFIQEYKNEESLA